MSDPAARHRPHAEAIRVRGLVQGVGFRPTVWRLAHEQGLVGDVLNDGDGVLIRAWGSALQIDGLCRALLEQCPPLARIDLIERRRIEASPPFDDFRILASSASAVHTAVAPDAAICDACAAEIADPNDRRYRYPFTNCTHCGPRLSIVRAIPYDRASTSMSRFPMCIDCAREYADPGDRRFHAQPNACTACGPRVWLVGAGKHDGLPAAARSSPDSDPIDTTSRLLAAGGIVAIKGIGGFHLACDATNGAAVGELRRRKRRYAKPFALMAADLDVIRRSCRVSAAEADLLASPAAPIVLLDALDNAQVASEVAPGQRGLGFMLPYSPLHRLLLAGWDRPLVMTSGNLSDEPQCIDNDDAVERLAGIADAWLMHDRDIVNRVDDSVVRVMAGAPRWLRRARGAAPTPLSLPRELADAEPVLALGSELKNTICVLQDGQAILSQHLGDLEEAQTAREFEHTIDLYCRLFEHHPACVAVDLHPDYRSTVVGRALAERLGVPVIPVQHHAAHLASVLADNGRPLDAGPVLGIMLDGLGYGADGTIWGGELLLGDYRNWRRIGHLRPVPLLGGERANREPWRNLYAQVATAFGWEKFQARWGGLDAAGRLQQRPIDVLGRMLESGLGSPLGSSAGRLFDAVAAALGICFDGIAYEGQAAIELETLALQASSWPSYALGLSHGDGQILLDPRPMWHALLDDLAAGTDTAAVAAGFHAGFAESLCRAAVLAAAEHGIDTVALSGGVFQNRTLFEALVGGLEAVGLRVLAHCRVPCNDGGLTLGQAVMAAAQRLP